jgi:NAD(P)-dependent dehydrogenase (short-subunit alcohol dehydrogenase family)
MNIKGNTVLITGGATGIGFSLAEHFVKAGNNVIVCGRRQEKLREAKNKLPQIHTRECDLSKDNAERLAPVARLLGGAALTEVSPFLKVYFFAADRAWTYERVCGPALPRG